MRRGILATLIAMFMVGGSASLALAATTAPSPGPSLSLPPQCFEVKNGALPTCEQESNGEWTAIYPDSGGNLDPSENSSGGSNSARNLGLVALVVGVGGVIVIIWRQWGATKR